MSARCLKNAADHLARASSIGQHCSLRCFLLVYKSVCWNVAPGPLPAAHGLPLSADNSGGSVGGMDLRQITAPGEPDAAEKQAAELPNPERMLTLVVDGAARGVPEIDGDAYSEFRANIARLAQQLPDRLPEEDKLAQVRDVLREFENYRKRTETELRERRAAWRTLASFLFNELLGSLGVGAASASSTQLLQAIASAVSAQSVQNCQSQLQTFLHPVGAGSTPTEASGLRKTDHSTANDNAAGLRGGGSAIEHVQRILNDSGKGFVVLFRLSCLSMIDQRFGAEAVEDCLMAVSAFLTQSLHSDDAIYHWSDSSLLAVLRGRANQQILTAELDRIATQNRETTITIGGRSTMLRIPITFDVTPIERLKCAEDLYKITLLETGGRAR